MRAMLCVTVLRSGQVAVRLMSKIDFFFRWFELKNKVGRMIHLRLLRRFLSCCMCLLPVTLRYIIIITTFSMAVTRGKWFSSIRVAWHRQRTSISIRTAIFCTRMASAVAQGRTDRTRQVTWSPLQKMLRQQNCRYFASQNATTTITRTNTESMPEVSIKRNRPNVLWAALCCT